MILASAFVVLLLSAPSPAAVLAEVNGVKIETADLEYVLGQMTKAQRQDYLKDPTNKTHVVNQLVDQQIMVQNAKKKKVHQSKDFKSGMALTKRRLLVEIFVRDHFKKQFSDAEVKAYYDSNKRMFSNDQVHAYHILLRTRKEAVRIKKLAQKKDADFRKLAETHSIDPTAKKNRGDLGFFTHGRYAIEFEEAAFAGKRGEVTGPVKSAYGHHLIKVLKKETGSVLDFDDVKKQVSARHQSDVVRRYLSDQKGSAKIKLFSKAIKKIR